MREKEGERGMRQKNRVSWGCVTGVWHFRGCAIKTSGTVCCDRFSFSPFSTRLCFWQGNLTEKVWSKSTSSILDTNRSRWRGSREAHSDLHFWKRGRKILFFKQGLKCSWKLISVWRCYFEKWRADSVSHVTTSAGAISVIHTVITVQF